VADILHSTLRERGQVTVPAAVREALDVHPGDELVFQIVDGVAVISAGHVVPKSQAWFWTPEWQAGEREASDDIAAGRTHLAKNVDEFLANLDES
jgi:antitoxin PrlF